MAARVSCLQQRTQAPSRRELTGSRSRAQAARAAAFAHSTRCKNRRPSRSRRRFVRPAFRTGRGERHFAHGARRLDERTDGFLVEHATASPPAMRIAAVTYSTGRAEFRGFRLPGRGVIDRSLRRLSSDRRRTREMLLRVRLTRIFRRIVGDEMRRKLHRDMARGGRMMREVAQRLLRRLRYPSRISCARAASSSPGSWRGG